MLFLATVIGLSGPGFAAAAIKSSPAPVCRVIRDAPNLIGKRVRVEGYVLDLGSHGFVLGGKRKDCTGHLKLSPNQIDIRDFENAVAKRAILAGIVRWHWETSFNRTRNPELVVEQVEYLSHRDAHLKDF